MAILYALVARGTVVLAEFTATSTNASTIAKQILEKVPGNNNDSNVSYSQDRYVFHVKRTDGLTVICMAEETAGRRIPFTFLEDIHQRFVRTYGRAVHTAQAYAMNEEFSRVLSQQIEYYSNDPNADRINRIKGEMSQVRDVMIENIDKVLDRGERLELLVDKTATMQGNTFRFRKQARRFRSILEKIADDTDAAKEFFVCLDTQLNKVNQFYKTKEKEFLERGECMKKQMEILIELKDAFKQKQANGESTQESKEDDSISCTISCEEDSVRSRTDQMQLQESCLDDLENNGVGALETPRSEESIKINSEDSKLRTVSGRVFNCQGKNLKIKIPLTNPSRTFSAISYLIKEDLINQSSSKKCGPDGVNKLRISKKKLSHAEKMIKGALTELYKGLNYLKTYRSLNMLAFMNILKKFDKVTGKQILPIYLKVVESSYFNSSDKVINLSDEVEEWFIKHFAGENRRKAMKYLKPHHRKESHSVTFFIGLFTGCFVALLAGYIIVAHLTGMYRKHSENTFYMETAYPVLSMFGLLFLHLFLYGCNIFMWRKARINYSFIFELGSKNELKFRDVFLICTASMSVIVGVMFVHLLLLAKGYSLRQVQVIPGLLLLVFFLILICPLNIFYKSSRYRLITVIRNIVFSPLYKVVMLDFFMADQLCSQVPMLRNLEYIACYYITGSYATQDYGYCMRVKYYRDLAYAVSFLPYYWRAMQCARRWFDEGEMSHLVNLGKYVSAMLAAGTKVAYEKERSTGWLCLVVAMSSIATVYQLYWDFVKDWGLLQHNSNNPWLRNQLMLRQKYIYYFSMVLNLVLRLAWLQTVLHSSFEHVDYRVTGLFLAALEVIRRGHWNFYRLENEHLNNAGKFRAVKTVPLPFREVDEED